MLGAGRADAIALRLTGLRDGFLLQPLSLGPLCRPPGCFGCLPLHPLSLGPLRRQPRCLSFRAFLPPPLRLSGRQPRGLYPFPLPPLSPRPPPRRTRSARRPSSTAAIARSISSADRYRFSRSFSIASITNFETSREILRSGRTRSGGIG